MTSAIFSLMSRVTDRTPDKNIFLEQVKLFTGPFHLANSSREVSIWQNQHGACSLMNTGLPTHPERTKTSGVSGMA